MAAREFPAPDAATVEMRFASPDEPTRSPDGLAAAPLARVAARRLVARRPRGVGLADGAYEYEFVLDGGWTRRSPIPSPTRSRAFPATAACFACAAASACRRSAGTTSSRPERGSGQQRHRGLRDAAALDVGRRQGVARQFGLGTFDEVIFRHLDRLADLGVNAIELMPIQEFARY